MLTSGCNTKNNKEEYTNHLAGSHSPYLLKHAHNPVDWYPWGEEALTKAKKENKLLIISIGYAACHWCHVMERECFEDTTVARFMNEHFVSIKVDREERPDIDQIYLQAVQLMTGTGGWPLNCIALPDGKPIFGGTYFPKEQWLKMLRSIHQWTKENPQEVLEQANQVTRGIAGHEIDLQLSASSDKNETDVKQVVEMITSSVDTMNGGIKGEMKFPMPSVWQYLLYAGNSLNDKSVLDKTHRTLNKMADGGIYDQIGGGFCRYTTDPQWKIPHFEKMLYDNAQLVSLYSDAFRQSGEEKYRNIVFNTVQFIEREMTDKNGLFYSSIDAESEGVEGKFYVWTEKEFLQACGDNQKLMSDYFQISKKGNWEKGRNILYRTENINNLANKYQMTSTQVNDIIERNKRLLFEARSKRIRPATDKKIITSWNAMMIEAYCDAYRAFGEESYLANAVRSAEAVENNLVKPEGTLYRSLLNGQGSVDGFLDDYTFLSSSYISLYQVTFNEKWINRAHELVKTSIRLFGDEKSVMFYYTTNSDQALIARKMEFADEVIPSSNSEMAINLYQLGQLFYNEEYLQRSADMVKLMNSSMESNPVYFSNWARLQTWLKFGTFEIAIAGKDNLVLAKKLFKEYLPDAIFCGTKQSSRLPLLENKYTEGQTLIYVCRNKVCKLPVNNAEQALLQMQKEGNALSTNSNTK
jgi:uncharacterized protein